MFAYLSLEAFSLHTGKWLISQVVSSEIALSFSSSWSSFIHLGISINKIKNLQSGGVFQNKLMY